MIPMKCTKELVYAGKRMKAGTEFAARGESDARLLVAIKKAERVSQAVPVVPVNTYQTRTMTADTSELDGLRAQANARGIKFHHMSGVKKLRELLSQDE